MLTSDVILWLRDNQQRHSKDKRVAFNFGISSHDTGDHYPTVIQFGKLINRTDDNLKCFLGYSYFCPQRIAFFYCKLGTRSMQRQIRMRRGVMKLNKWPWISVCHTKNIFRLPNKKLGYLEKVRWHIWDIYVYTLMVQMRCMYFNSVHE